MKATYVFEDLLQVHQYSYFNRRHLNESFICGCFSCCETFTVTSIVTWIEEGKTAVCPNCRMDAMVGDACGIALTTGLLQDMRRYWFDGKPFLAELGGAQHLILPGAAADLLKRGRYSSMW